jgi:GPH family glycoside/pentoside/hexuronide:cation symporter
MNNNLGYSEERQSSFFVFMTLMSIVWIPAINYFANKFDKRTIYYIAMSISTVGFLIFGLTGFASFTMLLVFITIFAFGNCTFWTVYYSMMYDISELDEFINSKRREGSISALMSFFQKLGSAFCMWLIGMLLELANYDGAVAEQAQSAQDMILYINTLVPAAFGVIAVICGFAYPLTGARFGALMKALEAKRAGKKYSTEGFEKLL